MKKLSHLLFASVLLAVVCFITMPVSAAQKMTCTLGPGQKPTKDNRLGSYVGIRNIKATSDNPDVFSVSVKWEKMYDSYAVKGTAKKAGTANVKVKYDGSTDQFRIRVLKYSNPIKSVTIAGIKIPGKYFDKKDVYRIRWNRVKGKRADMKVKLKKGWTMMAGDPLYAKGNKLFALNMLTADDKDSIFLKGGKKSRIGFNLYHPKKKYGLSSRFYIEFY